MTTSHPAPGPDERYFIALANQALDAGDLGRARSIAVQYASARRAERAWHRVARRFHLAA